MSNSSPVSDVKDWDSLPGWARAFASAFVVTVFGAVLLALVS